jgi:ABC-type glycerol-3-phosphate transport system substrate-binding protein
VVAGDPPADIMGNCAGALDKDTYQHFVDLRTIDFEWWDNYTYDVKNQYSIITGIKDFTPTANPFQGFKFSFIFYEDLMEEAGLDPKGTVRTLDDLRAFLGDLKAYVDQDPDVEYVWDIGWHSWVVLYAFLNSMTITFEDGSYDNQIPVWMGDVAWTDLENNPFRHFFEVMKEFYDAGYFPEKWWTRRWEEDYEASFIAQKSIFTYHGPWLWDKVEAANPDAMLDGMHFPSASGKVWSYAISPRDATVLFTANMDKPNKDAVIKAFNWWHSPEAVKMRAEALGQAPAYDMSSVGAPELTNSQYLQYIKPVNEGVFGELTWENGFAGQDLAVPYAKSGLPAVLASDDMAEVVGNYFEGNMSLEELMETVQARWDALYPELAAK